MVDTPMAADTEASDAAALGRHLEDDELDDCRPAESEDDRRRSLSVCSTMRDPVTSETEPGGLFPARLGPSSLLGLTGGHSGTRGCGIAGRAAVRHRRRRRHGRQLHSRRLRRRRSLWGKRHRRRRHRGRRHDRSRDRRDGHRRERQRGQRDRGWGNRWQSGSGRRPAPRQSDDHQGALDGAAPQHRFHPDHFCRPDAPKPCNLWAAAVERRG
jgi:hypothetical protein